MDAPTGNGPSNHLRELREKAELAQEALARRAGVSVNTVSRFERNPELPRLGTARKLASALGVSVEEIWPTPREEVS